MPDKWEWTLRHRLGEYAFGDDESPMVLDRWDVSAVDLRVDDVASPRSNGVLMGTDFKGGMTLSFDLWARGDTDREVQDKLTELRRFWDATDGIAGGGDVLRLDSPYGRSVFGRPRKIAPTNVTRTSQGWLTVTADFECVSDLWFGDEWSALVSLVPPLGRGLVAPLVEPLTIQGVALNASGFVVPGDSACYPVIEFRGPITNPSLHAEDWTLRVRGSLAYDEVLRVDTRPWVRSLSLNGRPVAGMLMPSSSRLRDVVLRPGFHSVQLRGTDITGTASVNISGEATYSSF